MLTTDPQRISAYHEAGHAAMAFHLGIADRIVFIDMVGNEANVAWIRITDIPELEHHIMYDLAGYAVEARLNDERDWLWELLDEMEWIGLGRGHDVEYAVESAKALYGGEWKPMLCEIGERVDNALAESKLWRVVEMLAARLGEITTRMSGETVCEIMQNASKENQCQN